MLTGKEATRRKNYVVTVTVDEEVEKLSHTKVGEEGRPVEAQHVTTSHPRILVGCSFIKPSHMQYEICFFFVAICKKRRCRCP